MKIGLLVDSQLSREAKYLLKNMDIDKVYVQVFSHKRKTNKKTNIFRKVSFKIISIFESFFLKLNDLEYCDDIKTTTINMISKNSKGRCYVDKVGVSRIKKHNLDVLVRCGSGILSGEILNITKYGIVSLHHGDISFMRGRPAGFYEQIFKRAETGFVIQKLTETLDGGEIIFKGTTTTVFPWTYNYDRVYNRSLYYLKMILSSEINLLKRDVTLPYSGLNYSTPSLFHQLLYIKTFLKILNRFLFNRVSNQRYYWSVFFQRKESLNGVNFNKGVRVIPRFNSWLADPFAFSFKGKDYIFLEDFKTKDDKAVISVYEVIGKKQYFLGECIVEKFHLSFPRVFEHNDQLYLTLESADKKGIRIYNSEEFPLKWSYSHSILNEFYCGDPIIYSEDDNIFLLVSISHNNINDFNTDLFKFKLCDDLTQFESISNFPLISSTKGGRNAGLAVIDKEIKRIGQVQDYLIYGKSLSVHNMKSLKIEDEIVLHPDSNYLSIHTLNSNNGVLVYDMAKYRKLNSSH